MGDFNKNVRDLFSRHAASRRGAVTVDTRTGRPFGEAPPDDAQPTGNGKVGARTNNNDVPSFNMPEDKSALGRIVVGMQEQLANPHENEV
jgi:hypothetical protein